MGQISTIGSDKANELLQIIPTCTFVDNWVDTGQGFEYDEGDTSITNDPLTISLVVHNMFNRVARRNMCFVERLYECEHVGGVKMDGKRSGTFEILCSMDELLGESIEYSFKHSIEGVEQLRSSSSGSALTMRELAKVLIDTPGVAAISLLHVVLITVLQEEHFIYEHFPFKELFSFCQGLRHKDGCPPSLNFARSHMSIFPCGFDIYSLAMACYLDGCLNAVEAGYWKDKWLDAPLGDGSSMSYFLGYKELGRFHLPASLGIILLWENLGVWYPGITFKTTTLQGHTQYTASKSISKVWDPGRQRFTVQYGFLYFPFAHLRDLKWQVPVASKYSLSATFLPKYKAAICFQLYDCISLPKNMTPNIHPELATSNSMTKVWDPGLLLARETVHAFSLVSAFQTAGVLKKYYLHKGVVAGQVITLFNLLKRSTDNGKYHRAKYIVENSEQDTRSIVTTQGEARCSANRMYLLSYGLLLNLQELNTMQVIHETSQNDVWISSQSALLSVGLYAPLLRVYGCDSGLGKEIAARYSRFAENQKDYGCKWLIAGAMDHIVSSSHSEFLGVATIGGEKAFKTVHLYLKVANSNLDSSKNVNAYGLCYIASASVQAILVWQRKTLEIIYKQVLQAMRIKGHKDWLYSDKAMSHAVFLVMSMESGSSGQESTSLDTLRWCFLMFSFSILV